MSINKHEETNGAKDIDLSDNHTIVSQDKWIKARKELSKKKSLPMHVIKLIKRDESCLGLELIRNMFSMAQRENKYCQNFLMEKVN